MGEDLPYSSPLKKLPLQKQTKKIGGVNKTPCADTFFSALIIDLKFRQSENKEILKEPRERVEAQVHTARLPSLPPCSQVPIEQGGTA